MCKKPYFQFQQLQNDTKLDNHFFKLLLSPNGMLLLFILTQGVITVCILIWAHLVTLTFFFCKCLINVNPHLLDRELIILLHCLQLCSSVSPGYPRSAALLWDIILTWSKPWYIYSDETMKMPFVFHSLIIKLLMFCSSDWWSTFSVAIEKCLH